MRSWLQPHCLIVLAMLVAAPGAALAHLLAAWLPGTAAVSRLNQRLNADERQIEREWQQVERLRRQSEQLRQIAGGARGVLGGAPWLTQRDHAGIMDQLAGALRDEQVSIEQLTFQEPGLYAAASATDVLACEKISLLCTGEYAGLTAALDRLAALPLPLRFAQIIWSNKAGRLAFAARLEIPFTPDKTLRTTLIKHNKLEFEDEP